MKFLCNFFAITAVVPDPKKGSNIVSPMFDEETSIR